MAGSVGKHKMQSVIEFISTYSWSFLILIVLIAVITVFVLTKGANTYSQSYCYISPGINCQNIILMSNGTGSKATLIFINELGTDISTASNSFLLTSIFVNGSSEGACYPSYVPNGGVGICNATMPGYSPSTGSQVALSFALRYEICSKAVCGPDLYSTSGAGTAFTAPYHDISMKVTLLTTPAGANVVVQGVPYTSNTQLGMLQGLHYNLYAQSIPGYTFTGWSASSSNITILNVNSQSTSGYALGNGQITASYTQTSPTSESTTSITTTIIPGALYLPAPTPSSQSVTQGSAATIADSGATGGTSPYTYQWLEEAPGTTSFTDAADCASPTSTTCSFSTTGSTAAGTYQFELKVTDSESPPLTITSSSASVTVLQCYQLTLSGTGGTESATPTSSSGCPSGYYSAGSSVSITATPSSGYTFTGWSGSGTGSYSGSSNPTTAVMNSAITESASYTQCYSLTLAGSGGTEAANPTSSGGCPSGEYSSGTSVSITGTPNSGYVFNGWSGSGTGSYTGMSNPASVTINSAITETANFAQPCTVTSYWSITAPNTATVSYTMYGGGGGGNYDYAGTAGSYSSGSFSITAGQTLAVYVGGGGGGASSDSGGGGGGGGSGYYGGGGGGADGSPAGGGGGGSSAVLVNGAVVAYANGGAGATYSTVGVGGSGGTSTAGGAGGYGSSGTGSSGGAQFGGNGAAGSWTAGLGGSAGNGGSSGSGCAGGGGGGYGGGGGAGSFCGGGGAGGSNGANGASAASSAGGIGGDNGAAGAAGVGAGGPQGAGGGSGGDVVLTGVGVCASSLISLSLSGNTGGTESASPSSSSGYPSGYYVPGTSVTITATPNSGYVFSSWTGSGSGSYTGTSNPVSITMGSAITESANFLPCYSLTLSGSGGSESANPVSSGGCPSGEYIPGTSVTITANPSANYMFTGWSGSGTVDYTGTSPSATVTMNGPITETANFVQACTVTSYWSITAPNTATVSYTMYGGGGGGNYDYAGTAGSYSSGSFSITAGQTLAVYVGGGGGGASSDQGGGGGGGGSGYYGGGGGGADGSPAGGGGGGSSAVLVNGAVVAYANGGAGATYSTVGVGGSGGTSTAGGAGGYGSSGTGSSGGAQFGGNGAAGSWTAGLGGSAGNGGSSGSGCAGGGGGGYGGGGGAGSFCGGGGAGGSNGANGASAASSAGGIGGDNGAAGAAGVGAGGPQGAGGGSGGDVVLAGVGATCP